MASTITIFRKEILGTYELAQQHQFFQLGLGLVRDTTLLIAILLMGRDTIDEFGQMRILFTYQKKWTQV